MKSNWLGIARPSLYYNFRPYYRRNNSIYYHNNNNNYHNNHNNYDDTRIGDNSWT